MRNSATEDYIQGIEKTNIGLSSIKFARGVKRILDIELSETTKKTFSSKNPHPVLYKLKLFVGLSFTYDELRILAKKGDVGEVLVSGMPDGIYHDRFIGTVTVPKVIIVENPELYKDNKHLKFAEIIFDYYFNGCDCYLSGTPCFKKSLAYLDYR